ncbi:E3 ubiquitin-protein ligase rnf38 [Geranomyces variabilis]|nr:E3 ubiquitin-protein ligase rnf38 [Geranomyces variabilis]
MKALSTVRTNTQQSYGQHSHRDFVATSASSRPVSSSSISTTANSSAQRPGAVFYDEDSDYLPSPSVFLPSGRHGTSLRAAWDNVPVTAVSSSATLLGDSSSSSPSSPELVSALSFDRKGKGPATRAASPQKPLPPPFDEDVPLARVRREKRKTWTRAAAAASESELLNSLGLATPSSSALAPPATTTPDNQKPRRKKRSTAPPALALSSSSSSTASAPTDLDGSVEILSIVPPAAPVPAGRCDDRASNRNTAAGASAQPDIIADHEWPPSPLRVRRQRQPAVRPYTEQETIDLTSPGTLGNIPVLSGFDAAIVAQSRALHEAKRRHDERLAEMAARAAGFDDWFAEPAISSSASSSSTALGDTAPRTNALLDNSTRSSVTAPRSQRLTAALPTASMLPQRLGGRALRPSNSNQTRSSHLRRLMRNRDDDDVVLVDHVRAASTVTNVPLRREPRGTPADRRARRAANILRSASPPPLSDEEIARQLQEEEYGILQPPNAASIIAGLARNYRMTGQHAFGSQPWLADDLSGYPPEILNALVTPNGRGQAEEYMADGELSYERLLAISERIGDARPRGLAPAQVSALPSRKFTAGCMPEDEAQCSVCLADYEVGETLRSAACAHWFHSVCLRRWLKQSHTCPVCRASVL